MTTPAQPVTHKPESMHYGECPKCKRRMLCVLLYIKNTDGSKMTTRRYYVRRHRCGSRLVPRVGTVEKLRSSPEPTQWTGSK